MAAPAQPQQKKTLLMTEGSIWKSILLFSVPLILGNLLQQLYNTADSIIVGNFLGSNALAAVGSSGSPIYLLIGFSQGVAVGAGVVVSQYLGAKDKKETHIAVHTSLAIAAILGLILTVGGIAVSRSLLVWMNTPEEVLGDAVTYMKLYFGGVLFSVVYNMAAGILNAAGNSRRSVIYLACASITNIILDLVLIAGLKMGVAGAAIATDISQLVSCVLSLRFLMKVDADYTVVAFGCSAMHYFCPFYFLLAILHGMAGAVRGTGRSVPPMVVLLISLCLFRVVWIQFVLPFFAGIEGVFVLYPVSWALGAVLMALYAWKGSWMTYEHS